MHFIDCRHYFPGLKRIVKRLKHLLCTRPAWPLPHSWATISPSNQWGSLGVGDLSRTCRVSKLGACLALHRASRPEFWPGFLESQRDLEEALEPGSTPGLAETLSHHHHLNKSCPIDDGVLPPGGHHQHSPLLQSPVSRVISPPHPTCL